MTDLPTEPTSRADAIGMIRELDRMLTLALIVSDQDILPMVESMRDLGAMHALTLADLAKD